jgi:hypothetical protein
MISWRTVAIVLAIVCCIQRWQSCARAVPSESPSVVGDPTRADRGLRDELVYSLDKTTTGNAGHAPAKHTRSLFGLRPPAWAAQLLPQQGETMRAYRDRVVPIAQVMIAPQRERVVRARDALDDHERAELDAAQGEAAAAIEARITSAFVNGELQPSALRPMTGVTLARDILDIVDRGNTRFVGSLTPEQRAESTFDFADYLLFATRWEDALPGR